jgi:hypothetical protein
MRFRFFFVHKNDNAGEASMSPYVATVPLAVSSAEREVENAVKAAALSPFTMGELVMHLVRERKLGEANVREAVWRLISAGSLRLSPDRTIIEAHPR